MSISPRASRCRSVTTPPGAPKKERSTLETHLRRKRDEETIGFIKSDPTAVFELINNDSCLKTAIMYDSNPMVLRKILEAGAKVDGGVLCLAKHSRAKKKLLIPMSISASPQEEIEDLAIINHKAAVKSVENAIILMDFGAHPEEGIISHTNSLLLRVLQEYKPYKATQEMCVFRQMERQMPVFGDDCMSKIATMLGAPI